LRFLTVPHLRADPYNSAGYFSKTAAVGGFGNWHIYRSRDKKAAMHNSAKVHGYAKEFSNYLQEKVLSQPLSGPQQSFVRPTFSQG
jgi:hypothetical protein